ncbi:MAG: EAL domain-containing protein [Rhodospirillaceae bacterium]|nr:EAL domain-containing protein [Rhodospirillaceae bacterium]
MSPSPSTNLEMARYMAFAFCTADALLEIKPDGVIMFATGATHSLFGMGSKDIVGEKITALASPEESTLILALMKMAASGQRFNDMAARFHRRGDSDALITLNGYSVPDLGGNCFITAKAAPIGGPGTRGQDRDSDSGLMDADGFGDAVEARLANPDAEEELTFIGLAGLPELEGRLSPGEWQLLQQRIGTFLNAVSAGGDTAAQLGDDKFGLLHDKGLPVADVESQLQQFSKDADPRNIGVEATSQSLDPNAMDLSGPELARAVLYTIRQVADSGGGAAEDVLSANISDKLQDAAQKIALVKATIDGNLFDIAYQPIVSLANERVHHFEALVRITDPECPFNTFEFVCFTEDVGLAVEFDLAMCRKLMSRLKTMSERDQLIPVAMNISGHSINSDGFVDELQDLLAQNPGLHGAIMFEITETARIQDLEKANEIIRRLRAGGFHVCLDDFGSGEAAFEYLRVLEVDFVKIDGIYVEESTRSSKGKAFLKAMSGLCHDLGMATIAERIETREELAYLKEIGVAYGQGYLFGKPDPGADLTVRGNDSKVNARRKGAKKSWG